MEKLDLEPEVSPEEMKEIVQEDTGVAQEPVVDEKPKDVEMEMEQPRPQQVPSRKRMREDLDEIEGYLHHRPPTAFMPGHALEPDLDFRVLCWNSAGQVAL